MAGYLILENLISKIKDERSMFMKKEIKIIGLLIVLCLLFSTSIPSFACPIDDNSCSAETEENIDNYKIVYEDGNYYVRPIRSRIGSGIGKCPQQKKHFIKHLQGHRQKLL